MHCKGSLHTVLRVSMVQSMMCIKTELVKHGYGCVQWKTWTSHTAHVRTLLCVCCAHQLKASEVLRPQPRWPPPCPHFANPDWLADYGRKSCDQAPHSAVRRCALMHLLLAVAVKHYTAGAVGSTCGIAQQLPAAFQLTSVDLYAVGWQHYICTGCGRCEGWRRPCHAAHWALPRGATAGGRCRMLAMPTRPAGLTADAWHAASSDVRGSTPPLLLQHDTAARVFVWKGWLLATPERSDCSI